jgi:membrane protein
MRPPPAGTNQVRTQKETEGKRHGACPLIPRESLGEIMSTIGRVDRYQREHTWLGFGVAVAYKFADDRGAYLAALVSYYAFVSLFPLLLLFFSALGFFLQGHETVRDELAHSAVASFPVIGPQLQHSIGGFRGSGPALIVGILGTLYGALGAMQAAQAGFNQIYGIPRHKQPNPLKSRLRSFALVLLLGGSVLLTTGISALVAIANSAVLGDWLRVLGYLLSFAINAALLIAAYQLLTARELHIRNVITGGLITAAAWEALQTQGSRYMSHELSRSSVLYGTFGVVLATIAWIYLQALVLMLSAEINVVLHYRLWPRSLLTPFTDDVELTEPDRRAYAMYTAAQRFKGFETVTADFSPLPRAAGNAGMDEPRPRPGLDAGNGADAGDGTELDAGNGAASAGSPRPAQGDSGPGRPGPWSPASGDMRGPR